MQNELSLIDAAVVVLQTEKKAFDLYQLFDIVSAQHGLDEDEKSELITKFYADLTTSAKFVYVGDNTWDLKANQKIELWEKDGSFYKEYTVVELPEEYKKEIKEAKAKTAAAKLKAKAEAEGVVVVKEAKAEPAVKIITEAKAKPVVEPVVEAAVEEVIQPVIEPVVEDVKTEKVTVKSDDPSKEAVETYEEEVFEEYEDFDEDKYNEYMDTYEDKYDSKK